MPSMSSQRPYLLRAIHQWILDNGCTPYLVIDADAPGVQVPRQYVNEGRIVLNVAPGAVNALIIGNSEIDFDCR
ncbi:MAG TPA: ClpXP protease specificity-enhancing factor SspB, partial [Pseudomonadales bacterium]|nr:ClpXP protease specificity-enhancing factor SspB [Pseudomonadales bacterium]